MASIASWILTVCGAAMVLIGAFFVAARPPLLPEDARYMRTTVGAIVGVVPELSSWLRRVFWVLGGLRRHHGAARGVRVQDWCGNGQRRHRSRADRGWSDVDRLDVGGQLHDPVGLQVGSAGSRRALDARSGAGWPGVLIPGS